MSANSEIANLDMTPHQKEGFYGALFALAAADGETDRDELDLIYQIIDTDGLTDLRKNRIYQYAIDPPSVDEVLKRFKKAPKDLRYGIMMCLVEVASLDYEICEHEDALLVSAQEVLGVNDEELDAMIEFLDEARHIKERGIDGKKAEDLMKNAVAGLAAAGVPLGAVYFGGLASFSAAGITSGLAALGLGLGMVPGIGMAVGLGVAVYMGGKYLMDADGKRTAEATQMEHRRKSQMAIRNLQETINALIGEIENLKTSSEEAKKNKEVLNELNSRLKKLQKVVVSRKNNLSMEA